MTDILTSLLHILKKMYHGYTKSTAKYLRLLDKHVPNKSKYVSQKSLAPWMTPDISQSERRRRYLERVWCKSRSSLDRSRYSRQWHRCNREMANAISDYYESMVSNNSATPQQLWKRINQILHRRSSPSLYHASIKSWCDSSSHNISHINSAYTGLTPDIVNTEFPEVISQLVSFKPATIAEVRKLFMSSPSKPCDLDPIPTILLKVCVDVLIIPITDIMNTSLCSGVLPDDFKCAHVNTVVKKTSLPKEDLNSYRPISNLSCISKLIEKVVDNRQLIHPMCRSVRTKIFTPYKLL